MAHSDDSRACFGILVCEIAGLEVCASPADSKTVHAKMTFPAYNLVNVIACEVFWVIELKMSDALHVPVAVDSVIDCGVLEHKGVKSSCVLE